MTERKESVASPPSHTFVRRLIPTVAVATLTFTGCPPEEDPKPETDMSSRFLDTGNQSADMGSTGSDMGSNPDTGSGSDLGGPTVDLGTDAGITSEPLNFTIDGTVSDEEIRQFCQGWSECDTTYFAASYASVDECVTGLKTSLTESLADYETYGTECVAAVSGQIECYTGAALCINGNFGPSYEAYENCYNLFSDQYDMFCQ